MVIIGAILIADIANNNVFGFLFGPLLVALGLVLSGVVVGKQLLWERLELGSGKLTHNYRIGGWVFGRREVPVLDDFYVRVRQRGLLGGSLELICDGHVRYIAGGVHQSSVLTPPDLFWLGQLIYTRAQPASDSTARPS